MCPFEPATVCATHNRVSDCDRRVCATHSAQKIGGPCTEDERQAARTAVESCLFNRFNSGAKIPFTAFDVSLDAASQSALLSTKMYADCDHCDSVFTVPSAAAERNRIAGFIVLWIGCSLWWCYIIRNGLLGVVFGWDGDLPSIPFSGCRKKQDEQQMLQKTNYLEKMAAGEAKLREAGTDVEIMTMGSSSI